MALGAGVYSRRASKAASEASEASEENTPYKRIDRTKSKQLGSNRTSTKGSFALDFLGFVGDVRWCLDVMINWPAYTVAVLFLLLIRVLNIYFSPTNQSNQSSNHFYPNHQVLP